MKNNLGAMRMTGGPKLMYFPEFKDNLDKYPYLIFPLQLVHRTVREKVGYI